jgi:predicted heme/steroid binding protein
MISGCSAQSNKPEEKSDELIELTMEEITQYNGENDRLAYVVVDGDIYDVTAHPNWANGMHGGNIAGSDITEMLDKNAPHGRSKLDEIEMIGTVVER